MQYCRETCMILSLILLLDKHISFFLNGTRMRNMLKRKMKVALKVLVLGETLQLSQTIASCHQNGLKEIQCYSHPDCSNIAACFPKYGVIKSLSMWLLHCIKKSHIHTCIVPLLKNSRSLDLMH